MVTTAASPVFVDTNVLVYSMVATAPLHAEARAALDGLRRAGAELWISRQVLREYMATVTRSHPWMAPASAAVVVADVARFQTDFRIAEDGPAVTTELLRLISTVTVQGKQIHDANIVATMLAHGVPNLLTQNVADFVRYAASINVLPLVPPASPTPPVPPPPGVP
jgi:predicted nucleic acid-binding protein